MSGIKGEKRRRSGALAAHAQKDDLHAVVLHGIRVMLLNDDGFWFARALELDYWAQGDTLDEVKRNFTDGLVDTVGEHLRMFGDFQRLLKCAPDDDWKAFRANPHNFDYSLVSVHWPDTMPKEKRVPMELLFLEPRRHQADRRC